MTVGTQPAQDTRTADEKQAHEVLAKAAYEAQLAATKEYAAQKGLTTPQQVGIEPYGPYNGLLTWGGFFYAVISVNFDNGVTFLGHSGGLVFGGGNGWGAGWFNAPIESLKGQSVRFEANLAPGVTNVTWWLMDGTYIGWFIGAGIPGGAGIVGGQGSFS